MSSDPDGGLEWLVDARNKCQTLMLRLYRNWTTLPSFRRQAAVGAVFSLWRAVFLLIREHDQSITHADEAAQKFLARVIRRNTIGFSDDLTMRSWSGVYYVENAMFRVSQLTGYEFAAFKSDTPRRGTVRDGWDEAFRVLNDYIPDQIQ
jgi:hypothetical protein